MTRTATTRSGSGAKARSGLGAKTRSGSGAKARSGSGAKAHSGSGAKTRSGSGAKAHSGSGAKTRTAKTRATSTAKLAKYHAKRDFGVTSEPKGRAKAGAGNSFVVQAHRARRMHYDFRLEHEGVLLSWAVPKGPSLDPKERRLAVQTEDHPIDYADFEGVIPEHQYGAGSVVVWDRGTWAPVGDAKKGLDEGKLTFTLAGEKLRGRFHLVRTRKKGGKDEWLLFKSRDEAAIEGNKDRIVTERPESVLSGRTLEEVARAPERVWHSKDIRKELPDPEIDGAVKKRHPRDAAAELATLSSEVPGGDGWVHEIKLDGYRILAHVGGGKVSLVTRNGKDWTERMRPIARELESWPVESAILDGEVVVLDERGISSFQSLQNALSEGSSAKLHYFVFDLLYYDGYDLRAAPLTARKELLAALLRKLAPKAGAIRASDHVVGSGKSVFENACKLGLEGIISKKADAPYRGGRGRDWLKIKCHIRQEVVIGGYTEPSGSRTGIGALVVGVHDEEKKLRFAGKVGTGFTARSLEELERALAPLEIDRPPFIDPPRGAEARGIHWVEPKLLAEIEATEVTTSGKLRHPSFKGLRTDKPAKDIVLEEPIALDDEQSDEAEDSARAPKKKTEKKKSASAAVKASSLKIRLTNPDRVYYPEDGITKRELVAYYVSAAERIMPYLEDRLVSIVRCPDGREGQCFYQRHAMRGMSGAIHTVPIDEKDKTRDYLYVSDLEGLVSLVQIGALEIHGWGSRVGDVERPDILVIDLDPDEGLDWLRVVEAAADVRDRLRAVGLESFARTTGGKGLHVVAPLAPKRDWEEVRAWAEAFAHAMAADAPKKYTSIMSKARRKDRVFIDYLRNARTATAVVSYSTRAKEHAPVATPLEWHELPEIDPSAFTMRTIGDRLSRDPWSGFFDLRQSLPKRPR
jgi:bifunctional non-homologous end joining protein LigD